MAISGRLHSWSPVVKAGLSFLLLSALLLPLGHVLRSSAIAGLGSETAFDGGFYLAGGSISLALKRSRHHLLNCTTRQGLELAALVTGSCFFALGALHQPSTLASSAQVIVGFTLGPAAIWLYWYWHRVTEAHEDHHHGFSWHLLADTIAAGSIMVAGVVTALTGEPAWNFRTAMVTFALVLILAIAPAREIIGGMSHRPANHPG